MNMLPPAPQHDPIGWAVTVLGAIVTIWTIAVAIYWTVRPGESDERHPKRTILRNDR